MSFFFKLRPSTLIATILIALTLWLLVSLGLWQLDRAAEKRQIEQAIKTANSLPLKTIKTTSELANLVHHQVRLSGHYDPSKQFIYDNQTQNGRAGYFVLTPFLLNDNNAILVNRGFVKWGKNRGIKNITNITIPQQKTQIKVLLVEAKIRLQLATQNHPKNFPILIQSLQLEKLSQASNYKLSPLIAQLNQTENHGFSRLWQPFYGSVNKHLAYALQWFLMALALLIIAIFLLIKQLKKQV